MKSVTVSIFSLAVVLAVLSACSDPKAPQPAPTKATSAATPESEDVQKRQISSTPLLKSRRANFTGKLPCKDCPGIEISIKLQRDEQGGNSFVLRYQRMERDATPAVISGNWVLNDSRVDKRAAAVITLNPGNPARQALLRINNDNSLTLIEGSLNGVSADSRPTFHSDGGTLDLQALYEEKRAKGDQD